MATDRQRRDSPQRHILLETLTSVDTHPTAAELLRLARKRLPRLSLGTVYRNLDILVGEGRVRRVDDAGAPARFDATTTPHDHALCRRCGRLVDVPARRRSRVALPPELAGFRVEGRRLQYFGVCRACLSEE